MSWCFKVKKKKKKALYGKEGERVVRELEQQKKSSWLGRFLYLWELTWREVHMESTYLIQREGEKTPFTV